MSDNLAPEVCQINIRHARRNRATWCSSTPGCKIRVPHVAHARTLEDQDSCSSGRPGRYAVPAVVNVPCYVRPAADFSVLPPDFGIVSALITVH